MKASTESKVWQDHLLEKLDEEYINLVGLAEMVRTASANEYMEGHTGDLGAEFHFVATALGDIAGRIEGIHDELERQKWSEMRLEGPETASKAS